MKSKVLFINPNFQGKIKAISQITVGPPLGLAYLAAVLENDNFNVRILDANALGLSSKEIISYVNDFSPDIIGLSAMTPTINQVHFLAERIKKILPNIKILIGGVHASTMPEDTLKRFSNFDVVVLHEGEKIISELCTKIINNKKLDKIPGIVFRKGKSIKKNEFRHFIENLDEIPFPARHLLPMKKYKSVVSDKFTTMIAMRGCYALCNYCSVPFFSGNKIRRRSPQNIIEEMSECFYKYGIRHFSFLDDTFTTDKKWVHDFCDFINASKLYGNVSWMCLTRVDNIDEKLLIKMKMTGCIKIEFGIESGSQKLLDFSKKGLKKDQVRKAFRLVKKVGIPTLGFLILNMPLETEESIKESKKFVLELDPTFLQVSFATPYPGTDLEAYAKKNSLWMEKDWNKYIFLKNITMENKSISRKRLIKLKNDLERAFYLRPKYMFRLIKYSIKYKAYNSIIRSAWNGLKEILK
ncbi:radical SAM protein [archaeon]|jgi:anaerobic magnesium-protoporphyrin IX monomethyl ester cyclase|nr:radical SAM protein [Candidatus Woesearchaeota archaeon]MBT4351466.1 radical SAM protein [archaeon]MBT4647545.1 radical SAM protein [archaeon]MBT6821959.1 radical SAM protein [archaeon]MBT7392354.1 radical SAM protein [archaeon]